MGRRKEKESKRSALLRRLYYDPKAPGSYSSASRLAKAAQKTSEEGGRQHRRVGPIDEEIVQKFLNQEDTYTLHRPVRRHFPRRRVLVSSALSQFQSDLVDMREWSDENDDFKWLLMTIDVFSKMGWAIPVKTKSGANILQAFQTLFEEKTKPPDKLQTDKGTEFKNALVQNYLKSKGITWFASEDDTIKAGVVERLNRTIQGKMWKYFHHVRRYRWIDALDSLMDSYNRTYHSSVKMTPEEAHDPAKEVEVRENLYGPKSRLPNTIDRVETAAPRRRLKVGDKVRTVRYATAFDSGYLPNWTQEVFVV